MNLIQIQDELKDLPTQVIMSYANGQNPEVPPYMALGELNRRKTSEQRKAEPPTQSVKEKLESQFQAPQMQQGMPQGMPQGAQQMPQGIAQLPGAQMQQGAPQAPPAMAGGGLAELPVRDDMFHYAPGGIVAFAAGDLVRGPGGEIIPEGDTAGEEAARAQLNAGTTQAPVSTGVNLQSLVPQAAQRLQQAFSGETNLPAVRSKDDIRKGLIADALADGDVEKAKILSQIPGAALIPLLSQLKAQNEASKAQFQEGQGRMGLASLSNALIAAGEATRGHKGLGFGEAMGGFGKSYNASTAEDIKRRQAQQAVERTQSIEVATLQSKIDDLRAAHATGTVEDKQAAEKAAQEQAYKMQSIGMGAAKDILAQALAQKQAESLERHQKQTERQAQEQLAATKGHYANQASQAAAALEVQRDIRREAIDARARAKLDEAMSRDPRIQIIRDKLKDPMNPIPIGSDEYNRAMEDVEKIRKQIIAEHPEFEIPDASGTPKYAKNDKGEVIVSYDNWKTNQPFKRTVTGGR